MTEPIPDDSAQRRTWLIAGVLALVVVLVGVGIALTVMALRRPSGTAQNSFTPAQETTTAPSAVTTSEPSSTSTSSASMETSSGPGGPSTSATTTPPGQIVRSAKIAYRFENQVWVSGEDGSAPKAVANSSIGAFALSPDGRTLVLMQGPTDSAQPVLIDVSSGVQTALPLAIDLPTWAPDSSWLAYTAGSGSTGYSVRRVNRDGSSDTIVLNSAAEPAISPDGKHIAFTRTLAALGATQSVQVWDTTTRTSRPVPRSLGVETFAYASGGVLYFSKAAGDRSLWMVDSSLSRSSAIASMPAGTEQQAPGQLYPSPDGSKVLFAMTGDDGYSRIVIADAAHKSLKRIDTIKDATPIGWELDGSGVFYVFGNAFQNEATSLYRMDPDGSHRKLVVNGGSL